MQDQTSIQHPYELAARRIAGMAAPKKPVVDAKQEVDRIAIESGVPANVILALAEVAQVSDDKDLVDFASMAASDLGPRIKAGEDLDKLIRSSFEDPAQAEAFINRAYDIADQLYPKAPAAEGDRKEGANLGTAFGVGVDALQQGYGSALEGLGRVTGLEGVEKYGADVAARNERQIQEAAPALTGLDDVDGAGSGARFAGQTIAQQLPQLGVSFGGMAAGAKLGGAAGAAFGPAGAAIGAAAGGLIGGAAANFPFFYGQNREAQKEAIDRGLRTEISEGAAAITGVGQAALDTIADRLMIGMGMSQTALRTGGLFTRIAKGAGAGMAAEVPTEIGQEVLQRLQAGLPIDDEEAIKAYRDAGVAAGLIGGTFGGVAGGVAGEITPADGTGTPPRGGERDRPEGRTPPGQPAPQKPAMGPLRDAMNKSAQAQAPQPQPAPMRAAAAQAPAPAVGAPAGTPVTVTIDGVAVNAQVAGETPLAFSVANEDGEIIDIPRADIDSGAVQITPVGAGPTGLTSPAVDLQAEADTTARDMANERFSPTAEMAMDFWEERTAALQRQGAEVGSDEARRIAAEETVREIERMAQSQGWDDDLRALHKSLSDGIAFASQARQDQLNEASKLDTTAPEAPAAPETALGTLGVGVQGVQPQGGTDAARTDDGRLGGDQALAPDEADFAQGEAGGAPLPDAGQAGAQERPDLQDVGEGLLGAAETGQLGGALTEGEAGGVQVGGIDEAIANGVSTVSVTENGQPVPFNNFALSVDGNTAEVGMVERAQGSRRGIGFDAYVKLGQDLASRGITLQSTTTLQSDGRALWQKLEQQGFARFNNQTKRFEFAGQQQAAQASAPSQNVSEVPSGGMNLVHGGRAGLKLSDIQIVRDPSAQKQGKKGRVYGGFYAASEADAAYADSYAASQPDGGMSYDVRIKPGTRVLQKQGDITRLSQSEIDTLVAQGIGVVVGKDPRGKVEYAVIDKSAIEEVAPRRLQSPPAQPQAMPVADSQAADPAVNAPAEPAAEPDRVFAAARDAVARGEVEHVTQKGKKLIGFVLNGITPRQAKVMDKYAFKKDDGWFIRAGDAKTAFPQLFEGRPDQGVAAGAPAGDLIENPQTDQPTLTDAPAGADQADPFVAAGMSVAKDPAARVLSDDTGRWVVRPAGQGKFRVTRVTDQVGTVAVPTRTLGLFDSPTAALDALRKDGAPITEAKPAAPKRSKAAPQRAQKRPLIAKITADIGKIHPDSPFAKELYHRGVDPRSAPGLFSRDGKMDWDNIPASENPDIAALVGISEDENYLDPMELAEAITREVAGNPQPVGEQAALLQAERDKERALAAIRRGDDGVAPITAFEDGVPGPNADTRTEAERLADIRTGLRAALDELGLTNVLTAAERSAIIENLNQRGGSVEVEIENILARTVLNAEQWQSPEQARPLQGLPFTGDEDFGRPEGNREPEVGSEPGDQDGRGPAEREARTPEVSEPPAPKVTEISPETFRNWKRSLPSTGTVRGWTVFDDTNVGGGWVLMSTDLRAGDFPSEAAARAWADQNPEAKAGPEDGKPRYPTTLEEVAQKPRAGEGRLNHIYAEYRGGRYYLASVQGNPDAPAAEWKRTYPTASIYTTDRADGTSIDGQIGELDAAINAASDAEWWTRISRENDGRDGRSLLERAGVGFDRLGRPWRDIRADDQAKILAARDAQAPTFEAGADGKPQAVMPGMEASDAQARQALTERQRLEMQAKLQQSKMRRLNGNEGDAGPLFNDQGDMFSGAAQATVEDALGRDGKRTDTSSALRGDVALSPQPSKNDNAQGGGSGQAQPAAKTTGKIEDFGEKIAGAKKDMWTSYRDRMTEAESVDIAAEPLSKSWPAPDYEKLIEAGVDPWSVSFVRAARDAIPRKPSQSWKQKGWVDQVRTLRKFANDLMNGTIDKAEVERRIEMTPVLARSIGGQIALYEAVGHGKSLQGLKLSSGRYSVFKGQAYNPPKVIWSVEKDTKPGIWGNMPRALASGDTREAAIEAFKKVYDSIDTAPKTRRTGAKFIIYTKDKRKTWVVGTKIGRNYIDLRTGLTDVAEARRIVGEEAEQLQAQLDNMRDIRERRDENAPRIGADHRNGADVTPAQFNEAFGFRGVQFGNWVEDRRRQQDLNDAYDALMDLAGILDVPPKALSLNGSLGLAFGARGSGGKNPAAAHYEPGQVVINLTKRAGRGSLAHEWFHAADNYFAKQRKIQRGTYITDNTSPAAEVEGVRPEVVDAFFAVKRAIAATGLKARSSNLDMLRSDPYWGTGIEMHARAFESYVIAKLEDQGASNDYLANVVNGSAWAMQAQLAGLGDSYPYLKPEEIDGVRTAFDDLFRTIETRETDTGVEMYSLMPAREPMHSKALRAAEAIRMQKGTGAQMLAQILKTPGVKQEEVDWIGLRDFLGGRESVTRQEVVDYIRANQVVTADVMMASNLSSRDAIIPTDAVAKRYEAEWTALNNRASDAIKRMMSPRATVEEADAARQEYDAIYDEREALHGRMIDETIAEMGGLMGDVQYSDWRTKGGENYRELLITIPVEGEAGQADAYRSHHWREPNVLAHIRFDEREVDGAPTMFIQEIQSDWHQAGRKKGYRPRGARYEVFDVRTGDTVRWVKTEAEARELADNTRDEDGKLYLDFTNNVNDVSGVLDAPLKKTWHETAFRRAVQIAVENGLDQVAWASGDMNAELFALSNQISRLEWSMENDVEVEIQAQTPDGTPISMFRNRDDLAEAVGKDMAERITAEIAEGRRGNTYTGLDLKVGGEGMRGFYDKIIPDYARKWGKKFGASISKAKTPEGEVWTMPITPAMRDVVATEGMPLFSQGPRQGQPVATLTGQELGAWADMRDLGRKAEAWYRDNLVGQTVINAGTGISITFDDVGARKIGGRKGDILYRSVPALREILTNGALVSSQPDNRGRPDIKAVHKFRATVELAGKDYALVATVREKADGTFHYDLSRNVSPEANLSAAGDRMAEARSGELDGLGDGTQQKRAARAAVRVGEAQVRDPALEGSPVELNIDFAEPAANREKPLPADLREITRAVNAEIASSLPGGKVTGRVVARLFDFAGAEIQGRYRNGRIEVNAAAPDGALGVARHEVVHALRDPDLWGAPYGAYTQNEWRELVRVARGRDDLRNQVRERYQDAPRPLTEAQFNEEVIAEMYREFGAARDASGPLARIFGKMRALFRALANAARGRGFVDHARIFERMANGTIGGRGPQGPGGGGLTRYMSKQKADAWFQSRRLQLPREGIKHRLGQKILQHRDVFKADGRAAESRMPRLSFSGLKSDAARDKAERSWLSDALTDAMGGRSNWLNILALLPGEPLFAELGKRLPSTQKYLRLKHQMAADRNELQSQADETLQEWRKAMSGKEGKVQGKALADLMHDATLAGVDPSMPYSRPQKRKGESDEDHAARVKSYEDGYAELRPRWDALPKALQAIYRKVRNAYRDHADAVDRAVLANIEKAMSINLERAEQRHGEALQRIEDEGLTGKALDDAMAKADADLRKAKMRYGWGKKARLSALRLQMESNRVQGPYFPLMRFGSYFVTVRDKQGKILSYSKFETAADQRAFAEEMRRDPEVTVQTGVTDAPGQGPSTTDPNFVADVEEMVSEFVSDPQLADQIWQRYLETLPDFSIRKSRIHRKGTPGFTADAFRVFARQMFHGAHQLARLRYGMDMQQALDNAKREADIAEDPNRARLVVNEMEKRHAFTMNPKSSVWSTWATSAAFVYYLGATPAAALVNLSQTTVVGIPVLTAGIKGATVTSASRHLMRALRDFTAGKAHVSESKRLTADERAAMKEAYRRGTIDKSQSHDLAGVAESGMEYSDLRVRLMKPIAFMFHHAERANREITFLAAYRMARESGMDQEAAIDRAAQLTWNTHFNYEADARPRFLQNDWMRVFNTFKNFQLNMLYRLFRDTHQILNGKTAEERREARTHLIGITTMMMLHAGITGTWGYALLTTLLGMFTEGGADEVEEEIKEALVGVFGTDIAGAMLKGIPGKLTGIDLTSRLGMPELWFRSPSRQLEGKDEYHYWVEQFLGPIPGILGNVHRGIGLALDGDVYRGAETAVPKFIRDVMKSGRYVFEGVRTRNGDPILEEVTPVQALTQALGFSPAQVSERYEMNNRRMNMQTRIQDERSDIMAEIANSFRAGKQPTPKMLDRMREFNARYPAVRIEASDIKASVKSRIRSSQRIEAGGGVPLDPRLLRYIDAEFSTRLTE